MCPPPPQIAEVQGRRNKILVGTVVKAKLGELEEEVLEGFSRRLKKEFNDVVQVVYDKNRFLVSFQDGLKKDLTSNQLITMIV